MQYSYFSVISATSSPGLFFFREKPWGRGCHFWPVPYKTEDPFRNCSCSSPEISLLVLKIFQHSKRNFVSPRGHVISSIVTCDQAIFFFFLGGGKKQYFPRQKEKIAWSQVTSIEACLFWFVAYGTRNIAFEARLFCFMAYRTRNITFQVR